MRVDEARRHVEPGSVDDLIGRNVAQSADGFDPVAPDEHVGANPGIAGPVHDTTVLDQDRAVLAGERRTGPEGD